MVTGDLVLQCLLWDNILRVCVYLRACVLGLHSCNGTYRFVYAQ